MNDPIDKTLKDYHRRFTRDHARRRDELLATLDGETTPTGRARVSVLRPLSKAVATLAAAAAIIGLVAWLPPGPVLAGEVFADVLEQVRQARTVAYRMTLTLPGRAARAARVRYAAPGREVTAFDDGDRQISDYVRGEIVYHGDGGDPWALRLRYESGRIDAPLGRPPLARLRRLASDAGRFVGRERLDGREVNVFVVVDDGQTMRIWAARDDDRPVRIEIAADGATLVLSEFAWDEPVDTDAFDLVPEARRLYEIDLTAGGATASPEAAVAAALRALAEAADGRYPKALTETALAPLLEGLAPLRAAPIDLGTGLAVIAGAEPGTAEGERPALVRYARGIERRLRVRRGLAVMATWTQRRLAWRYVGAGAQLGEEQAVLWYRPAGAEAYRVLLADGRWIDAPRTDALEE